MTNKGTKMTLTKRQKEILRTVLNLYSNEVISRIELYIVLIDNKIMHGSHLKLPSINSNLMRQLERTVLILK